MVSPMQTFRQLIEKAGYLSPEKMAKVQDAYDLSARAHEGQLCFSGTPYIEHPLQVALTLAQLGLDAASLAAALLHDVPEKCKVPIIDIEIHFGSEIAKLVDGVTRLGKISWASEDIAWRESQANNRLKMLVAMAEDIRVVFIALADRLHNMQTLEAMPPEKQRSIAQETMEVYAPLAHRLGIWELQWQLEDLSFRYIEPEKYRHIANLIGVRRSQREDFVAQATEILKEEFDKVGLKAEISGNVKNNFSIYQKMQKYKKVGKDFDDIHNLLTIQVLLATVADCYQALGLINKLWLPISNEFDDYIANPKSNGYQSLHTTVLCKGTTPLLVQIRTYEMHRAAEYGVAAHWRYKEGDTVDHRFEERVSRLRQMIDSYREAWSRQLMDSYQETRLAEAKNARRQQEIRIKDQYRRYIEKHQRKIEKRQPTKLRYPKLIRPSYTANATSISDFSRTEGLGTYSIEYSGIPYTINVVDWGWIVKGKWGRSDKELVGQWSTTPGLDEKALEVLLKHFGLQDFAGEFPLEKVMTMSPATLIAARREKERIHGLERIEPKNVALNDGYGHSAEEFN